MSNTDYEIRRYCTCGASLHVVANQESVDNLSAWFWLLHRGEGHGQCDAHTCLAARQRERYAANNAGPRIVRTPRAETWLQEMGQVYSQDVLGPVVERAIRSRNGTGGCYRNCHQGSYRLRQKACRRGLVVSLGGKVTP